MGSIRMDWETTLEVSVLASRTHVKRVVKDVIKARKAKGVYLRCGNSGYRIKDCTYLPPDKLGVNMSAIRPVTLKITPRVTPSRIRQIEEAIRDMDSDDFDEED
jgi:hypothetical protein